MKTKKMTPVILVILAVLCFTSTTSLNFTFAVDTPPNISSPAPSEVPNQGVTQNTETKKPSEGVAPSKTTPSEAQIKANDPTQSANNQPNKSPAAPTPKPKPKPAPAAPPPTNTPAPTAENPQTAPTSPAPIEKPIETQKIAEKSNDKAQEKVEEKIENIEDEEKTKAPEDLPEVESDEVIFPEVMSPSEENTQKPKNILAGVIAWTCIVLGIAIVIFVLIKGRHKGDIEPKTMKVYNSGHKKRTKRLLDDKYYKKR